MNVKLVLFSIFMLGCSECSAEGLRPISSLYGICLKGMEGIRITVNGPADVEFASLFRGNRIMGQFEITILGPTYGLSNDELRRWKNGKLIIVSSGGDYVGMKKIGSSGIYNSVYVRFRRIHHSDDTPSQIGLMSALSSCNLKAAINYESPPKLDSKPARRN